jgi:hypothetical protein
MSTEIATLDQSRELEQAITQRILQRIGRRIRGLEVKLEGGSIVLRGRTQSFHLKQLALQALLEGVGNRGLIRIEHDIQVEGVSLKTDPGDAGD